MNKKLAGLPNRAGTLSMLCVTGLVCIADLSAQPKNLKFFILNGQSNAAGIGTSVSQLPPALRIQGNAKTFRMPDAGDVGWQPSLDASIGCCSFGAEVTFSHDMAAALSDTIAIFKGARGGYSMTLVQDWQPPSTGPAGAYWNEFATDLDQALATPPSGYQLDLAGMTWMQGESDASDLNIANAYKVNLTNLINDIRARLKAPYLPFVIGMIDSVNCWPYAGIVRQAERDVAATLPNVGITDTKGFPKHNDNDDGQDDVGHYNAFGQMVLGCDYAAAMLRLLANPVPGAFVEPSDLIAVVAGPQGVKLTWRDNSSSENGFVIERRSGSGAYAQIGTVGAGTTIFSSYTDNTVAASTQYSYRVKATNGSGSTAYSNEFSTTPFGAGDGLKAQYFGDTLLTNLVVTRVDTSIDWQGGSPAAGIAANAKFSARWSGFVVSRYTETCTFFFVSDMMGKVWVDGSLVVDPASYPYFHYQGGDDWHRCNPTHCGSIRLQAGQAYSIKVEYYVQGVNYTPHAQLFWKSPSQQMQIVPKSQLHQTASSVKSARPIQPGRLGSRGMSVARNGDAIVLDGLDSAQPSTAVVSDVRGRTLRTASTNGSPSIDLRAMGNGAYFVSVKNGHGAVTRKVIVQR